MRRLHLEVGVLLNRVEKAMMNNGLRALLQRQLEARALRRLGGPLPGGRVLEVGCGRGVGVETILSEFGADRVDAFDLDPDMVAEAQARLAVHRERVRLRVGDACQIDADDASYDAVFDFAIIHHIPDWRTALREVYRVLRPGGRFYAEEVMRAFILHPLWRRVLVHPLEDRFDHEGFLTGLREVGFRVRGAQRLGSWLGCYAADK